MHTNDNYEIINPFADSFLFSDYADTLTDYAELSLDEITNIVFEKVPDIVTSLPIVKSAVALSKLGWSIKNAVVLRNQLAFIQSLNEATLIVRQLKKDKKQLNPEKNG